MADTLSIRNMILSTPLQEQPVSIPGWEKDANGNAVNLLIRELDGKHGADLMASCSDSSGTVNQDALVAGVILATLRNADDPSKALVFADLTNDPSGNTYDPAYRDGLMATGLSKIMAAATQSIKLSGLDAKQAVASAGNASSGTAPTVSASN